MKSNLVQWLCVLLLLVSSIDVRSHQGSTSYLSLLVEEGRIKGRWEIPVQDLNLALKLDRDENRRVTLEELEDRFDDVKSYALRDLRLSADGVNGVIAITNSRPVVAEFHDGASTALDFVVTNTSHPVSYSTNLEIEYHFMFDQKPKDRAFMQVECRGLTQTGYFTKEQPIQRFDLAARRTGDKFRTLSCRGAWHVWAGLDHYLFVLAWLLPAVLYREKNHWRAVSNFGAAALNVFKTVTTFTIASLLVSAALPSLTLPAPWVEPAIASSIVLAALNNLRIIVRGQIWMLAFVLGLIHGLGTDGPRAFESDGASLLPLLGLDLGMGAGQLVIAAALLPMAFALRGTSFYRSVILSGGSLIIAILALLRLL